MTWVLSRLAEPSTWAGIGMILSGLGPAIQNKDWPSFLQTAVTVLGGIAFGLPEGTAPAKKN
jgi:hypothetical protein